MKKSFNAKKCSTGPPNRQGKITVIIAGAASKSVLIKHIIGLRPDSGQDFSHDLG